MKKVKQSKIKMNKPQLKKLELLKVKGGDGWSNPGYHLLFGKPNN